MLASIAKTSIASLGWGKKKDPVVCDSGNITGLPSFDAERYMGNWFEIYHTKNQPFQPDSWTCSQATYSNLNTDDGTFTVYNSGQGRFHGPRFGVTGDGRCNADDEEAFGAGQCFVKFFTQPYYDTPNYEIIDTDYENYSLIYACHEDDMQYLWFMSRTPTLDDDTISMMMDKAKATLPNYNFDNLVFDDQDQKKCKYVKDKQ